ncbi:hypothetical protein DRQ25_00420 [Candidatus Fermentibacteria bacterium]|nr:MAG: hypothetical protein DRQ25_00420 [Candidatus Fermentibacteria bacterium]
MQKIESKQAIAIGAGAVGTAFMWKILKKKFRKKREGLYVDFDGTICKNKFPDVGEPEPYVREALTKMIKKYDIVIHSCRTAKYWTEFFKDHKPEEQVTVIEKFMEKYKIPYTRIETDHDKPFAHRYIGDEAINYNNNWEEIASKLLEAGKSDQKS